MKCKALAVYLVFAVVQIVSAQNPLITDVRNWWSSRWGAQVSSMDFVSHVDGLVARTVLTMNFKDIYSPEGADSMELDFNFNLPARSVIDSMYLWINGDPQNAAMKEKWSAVAAYNQVVGRRMDPALLTKYSGDAYNIKIFPFSHGQERSVRICYSTPLTIENGDLVFSLPVDMASGTAEPVNSVKAEVYVKGHEEIISTSAQEQIITRREPGVQSGSVKLTFDGSNMTPVKPLKVLIHNRALKETGMSTQFTRKDGGDISFLSVLEPGTATGVTNSRPKNILILWNMVGQQYLEIFYSDYTKDPSMTEDYYYRYNQSSIEHILNGIETLISRYMQKGDRLNILFNDGTIQKVYSSQTLYSPEMQAFVSDQLRSNIAKQNLDGGCDKPSDFLNYALSSVTDDEHLDLILIDQTYSYTYNLDTIEIDSLSRLMINKLPENSTVFGLIGYSWNNPIARIQNNLIQSKRGMAFYSWGDMTEIFSSIGRSLTPRIYPASVSFTSNNNSFIYDINGPVDDRIFYGIPVIYTGKICGEPGSFDMVFTWNDGEEVYRKELTTPVRVRSSNFDPIEKIWAATKVEKLISNRPGYAYNEYSEATKLSLQYRILTMQTALVAFEPGLLGEEWYTDDSPSDPGNGGGNNTSVNTSRTVPLKPSMQTNVRNGSVLIKITGLADISGHKGFSLKIYDIKGRLVADLTSKALISKGYITADLKSARLAKGIYIVRFVKGRTKLHKSITVR